MDTKEFRQKEESVEERSAVFKKELGLSDLVLTQILFVVGLQWVGVAAKQGASHIVLWLVAIFLFYIPSSAVIAHLNRLMPLEGGLYQWAKLGLNDRIGFMVAWNLWMYAILNMSTIGIQVTEYLGKIIGPNSESLMKNEWVIYAVAVVGLFTLVVLTKVGFSVGKWVHKAGGVLMIITFAALVIIPFLPTTTAIRSSITRSGHSCPHYRF
jgi:glutamate:GABA antiporter